MHPYHQHGIIRGYQVIYQLTEYLNDTYNDAGLYQFQNTTAQPPPNEMELKELALKSNYTFMIAAYTSKGMGAFSDIKFAMTGDFSKWLLFYGDSSSLTYRVFEAGLWEQGNNSCVLYSVMEFYFFHGTTIDMYLATMQGHFCQNFAEPDEESSSQRCYLLIFFVQSRIF